MNTEIGTKTPLVPIFILGLISTNGFATLVCSPVSLVLGIIAFLWANRVLNSAQEDTDLTARTLIASARILSMIGICISAVHIFIITLLFLFIGIDQ